MKTLLTLLLLIPSFSWGLTLKNGKIVDENKPIEFTENKIQRK